ncbi:MAG: lytic transglycosylase domain-containing protein [Bacillota bacterium]|nr:lytic transglycosylase domain-containing protein [Bacillota bacterium]
MRSLFTSVIILLIVLFLFKLPSVLERAFPLDFVPLILKHSEEAGVDPVLIAAVINAESAFRVGAISAKGAVGLMQLMPSTAAWLRGDGEHSIDLFQPETNIELGVSYLRYLLDLFPTEHAAIAAYNGGPSHVTRWLSEGVWDGSWVNTGDIPFGETRSFVRKVELMRRVYGFLYGAELQYGKE